MNNKKKWLVHESLAKSASSTLQNLVNNQNKINFLGQMRDQERSFIEIKTEKISAKAAVNKIISKLKSINAI